MSSKIALAVGLVGLIVLLAGVGSLSAATPSGGVCHELVAQLRSLCTAPGVTCKTATDAHARWEAVLATEPTMERAEKEAKSATARGFGSMQIEKDVQCSNGDGVYEVVRAGFMSHAAAATMVGEAKHHGFHNARTEDS